MNIMITANLSYLNTRYKKEVEYSYLNDNNEEEKIHGIQTNEAATKYFIRTLADKGGLNKILYMATKEVRNIESVRYKGKDKYKDDEGICINGDEENDSKAITTKEFYEKRITEFCSNGKDKFPVPEFMPIKFNDDDNIPSEFIGQITELMKEAEENKDEINVYFDITSGPRKNAIIIQLLVKFLTYKKFNFKKAVYSYLEKNEIQEVDTFEVLNVLDGVSQFITTGQSTLLKGALYKKDNIEEIDRLLDTMEMFTDEIQLCQTDKLDDILRNMKEQLLSAEQLKFKKSNLILFGQFIPIIREKFFGNSDNDTIDYLYITKWCVDNGLIQQALTIYTEKIPIYILSNIIKYDLKDVKDSNMNGTIEATALYSHILDMKPENEQSINIAKEKFTNINNNNKENGIPDSQTIKKFFDIENTKNNYCIDKLKKLIFSCFEEKKEENFKLGKLLTECFSIDREKGESLADLIKNNDRLVKILGLKDSKDSKGLEIQDIINAAKRKTDVIARNQSIKFLNSLMNNSRCIRILIDLPEKSVIEKKLDVISDIENIVKSGRLEIRAPEKVNIEDLQKVLYDYVYIKAVRNMINHASENENLVGESAKKYEELKYGKYDNDKDSLSITLEDVKNNIIRGINLLENL